MQIIKDGKIINDDVRHLADDDAPTGTRFTVSSTRWLKEKENLLAEGGVVGVRLHGGNSVAGLAGDLPLFDLVVVEFPALADGRSFSLSRLLRERYGYGGEIRARGDFIRDQVYFLARVGVNAFEPAEGTHLEHLLPALTDFTVNYQAAADDKEPVYRKRG
jgi:uncharacterized protein (DUF934 family)